MAQYVSRYSYAGRIHKPGLSFRAPVQSGAESRRSLCAYCTSRARLRANAESAASTLSNRGVDSLADFGLVVQDRTAGIYVGYQHPGAFAPGDDVEVNGVVDPGQFAPTIKAQSIRKLGRAPLPRPKEVTFKQLSTGDETSQYVSITGEVRSAGLRATNVGAQRFWLQIASQRGR